nr:zinc finger, PMZ-type [Tanacetum cinerariifolium]
MWKRTRNYPSLPPIMRVMLRRPKKERIKAPSENNSQVSIVGSVMRCSSCQGTGRNKASCDKEPFLNIPFKENHQAEQVSMYLELMHQQEVVAGVLEVKKVLEVVEMELEEVLEVEEIALLIELMDKDEIRMNLKHDYMQDLLDAEEDKREKFINNFYAFTQGSVINDPSHPTQSINVQEGDAEVATSAQDMNKGKDIQGGDADVAASSQYKKKGKYIQEGSNSQSATRSVRKSKRLRQEEPQPFRIYVKRKIREDSYKAKTSNSMLKL